MQLWRMSWSLDLFRISILMCSKCPVEIERLDLEDLYSFKAKPYLLGEPVRPKCHNCHESKNSWSNFCQYQWAPSWAPWAVNLGPCPGWSLYLVSILLGSRLSLNSVWRLTLTLIKTRNVPGSQCHTCRLKSIWCSLSSLIRQHTYLLDNRHILF